MFTSPTKIRFFNNRSTTVLSNNLVILSCFYSTKGCHTIFVELYMPRVARAVQINLFDDGDSKACYTHSKSSLSSLN